MIFRLESIKPRLLLYIIRHKTNHKRSEQGILPPKKIILGLAYGKKRPFTQINYLKAKNNTSRIVVSK